MKLSTNQKLWLYLTGLVLLGSGLLWVLMHYFLVSEGPFGPQAGPTELWSQRIHGAAAMVFLIVLGSLIPIHMVTGWKTRRKVPTALGVVIVNIILIVSGYGLYYFGGDLSRGSAHWSHIIAGIILPIALLFHLKARD